jgi:hypothetical protein
MSNGQLKVFAVESLSRELGAESDSKELEDARLTEPSGKDNFGCKTQGEKPVEGGMSRKRFTYPRVL